MAEQPLHKPAAIPGRQRKPGKNLSAESQQEMRQSLQQLMLHNVGIVRSNHSLIARPSNWCCGALNGAVPTLHCATSWPCAA
jgi:aspartate oxidase